MNPSAPLSSSWSPCWSAARAATTRLLPALAGLLVACEHGPAPAAAEPATPATPAMAVMAVMARGEPAGSCAQAEPAAQVLAKLNAYRAAGARCGAAGRSGGAAALTWQPSLAAVAAAHSREMAARNHLSHRSADGRDLALRLDGAGYAWRDAAENVAVGQPRLAVVVAEWMSSPGHCANLMNPVLTEAGLACWRAADGSPYWTLVLARPR